jgi:hypothetical protein
MAKNVDLVPTSAIERIVLEPKSAIERMTRQPEKPALP